MRRLPMPARQQRRWLWLGLTAFLAVFFVWFFMLRDTDGQGPGGTPPPQRPALGKTIPLEDYRMAVSEALAQVREAQSASGEEHAKAIESAIATLEGVEGAGVAPLGSDEVAEIDNNILLAELRSADPELSMVEEGLAALDSTLSRGAVAGPVSVNGEAARQELDRVLSDPVFDYERDLSPLRRLARWLGSLTGQADPSDTLWRWLSALIAGLAAGVLTYMATDRLGNRWVRLGLGLAAGLLVGALFYTGLGALGTAVQVIGAIGLVLAAVVVGLLVTGAHRVTAPAGAARRVSELAAVLGMSAAEGRRKAEEAAGAGDFRGAIRFRCLALLLAFDEAGKLHFDRAATNREYLFRAPGDLQGELQPLLTRFDAVWYGGAAAGEVEWRSYAAQAEHVEARLGEVRADTRRDAA